ncbi:MAG: serine/threonine-protein kinase, partial [Acidobacteriota bacterium]|nr:serine/threonine-protein kinase [Acidobacteriota bacterium]
NIKVRPDGTVKVLDFGLAKALDRSEGDGFSRRQAEAEASALQTITSPAMTMRGVILGTAAYMAPEQAKGKAVDKRADIWAFGVVLYEMLTGKRAFEGEDITDTIVAVVSKQPDWSRLPADTPPALRRLLRKCLEKDARRRLRDIGDVGIDLDETAVNESDARVPTAPERNGIWTLAPWGLTALLAIALIAGWVVTRPANITPDAGMVRFTLVDDPNMQVRFSSQPFATSPDGKTVVFSAAAGTNGLWVRSLDQPTPRFLSGTEGGQQPAIAPNGQWVAFVVANHIIRKVRLSGGAPTTIVSLDDVTAAIAWESNDSLVFEKIGSGSGIHRVNANGGQPELLIPLIGNEEGHYFPVVLGEPRLVFFASSSSGGRATRGMPASGAVTGEGTTLSVFSLDDRRRSSLNLDGLRALGIIDGHLVYARSDGSLMAVPFDARGLRVGGEPRLLDPRVSPGRFGPSVVLSESGTLV